MVERGWKTHVRKGEGRGFESARRAIETFRGEASGIGDQILPQFVVVGEDGGARRSCRRWRCTHLVQLSRGDRAIEISQAFEADEFPYFDRGPRPDVLYAGMMEYDGDLRLPSAAIWSHRPSSTEHWASILARRVFPSSRSARPRNSAT